MWAEESVLLRGYVFGSTAQNAGISLPDGHKLLHPSESLFHLPLLLHEAVAMTDEIKYKVIAQCPGS